jgi:malonyl-ACP O-methyltransferase BioC
LQIKEKIKHSFNEACKTYDSVADVHILSSAYLVSMFQELNLFPRSILDVGCGTGNTSAELVKIYPNADYTLCDLSENMVKHALQKIIGARAIVTDAEKYNFTENYDLGISNLAIQWFESIDLFLEKILKNCRCFAFSTLLDKSFCDYKNLIAGYATTNYPTAEELKYICQKYGLIKYKTKRYDLIFENPFGLARYFRKLGVAQHSGEKNILRELEGREINLNYDLVFAILKPI